MELVPKRDSRRVVPDSKSELIRNYFMRRGRRTGVTHFSICWVIASRSSLCCHKSGDDHDQITRSPRLCTIKVLLEAAADALRNMRRVYRYSHIDSTGGYLCLYLCATKWYSIG